MLTTWIFIIFITSNRPEVSTMAFSGHYGYATEAECHGEAVREIQGRERANREAYPKTDFDFGYRFQCEKILLPPGSVREWVHDNRPPILPRSP